MLAVALCVCGCKGKSQGHAGSPAPAPRGARADNGANPAQVEAMIRSGDPNRRLQGTNQLVALDPQARTDLAFKLMKDPDSRIRSLGISSLPRDEEVLKRAAPALVEALGDRDRSTVLSAQVALMRIRDFPEQLIPAVAAKLGSPHNDEVTPVLRQLGQRAAPHLYPLLKTQGKPSTEAFWLLGNLKPMSQQTALALAGCLKEGKNARAACTALERGGPDALPAVPVLVALMADANFNYPGDVADVLRAIGPKAADAIVQSLPSIDHDRREAAWVVLAGMGDSTVQSLMKAFKEGPPPLKYHAHVAMCRLAPMCKPLAPRLLEILKDKRNDAYVHTPAGQDSPGRLTMRVMALEVLRSIDPADRATIDATLAALPDMLAQTTIDAAHPRARARYAGISSDPAGVSAMRELRAAGEAAIGQLTDALKSPSPEVRNLAIWMLEGQLAKAKSAMPTVRELLKDNDPVIQMDALAAAVRIDPAIQGELYAGTLSGFSAEARLTALTVLRGLGQKAQAAVPAIIAQLADKDERVKFRAAYALANIPAAKEHVPRVAALLAAKDSPGQWAAAQSLELAGPDAQAAIPQLLAALKDGVQEAATAIVKVDPQGKSSVSGIIEIARGPNINTRMAALKALQELGPAAQPAVAMLQGLLTDKDPAVRDQACMALGRIGPGAKSATPAILGLLKIDDSGVRRLVGKTLRQIGPEAVKIASPQLLKTLNDDQSYIRAKALDVAAPMGATKEMVPAVIKCLGDNSDDLAMEALANGGPNSMDAAARMERRVTDVMMGLKAARALARIKPDPATFAEIYRRRGLSDTVRPVVIEVIVKDPAVAGTIVNTAIAKIQKKTSSDFDEQLVAEFGPAAAPGLAAMLKSPDKNVREKALHIIRRMKPPPVELLDTLRTMLKEGSSDSTIYIILADMGPAAAPATPEIMLQLKRQLIDPNDSGATTWAMNALQSIGPAANDSCQLLLSCYRQGETEGPAVRALGAMGPAAFDSLMVIHDFLPPGVKVREEFIEALGGTGEAALPMLAQWAADSDEKIRAAAFKGFIRAGSAAAPVLMEIARSGDPVQSEPALKALEELRLAAAAALPELRRLAAGPQGKLQARAQSSVRQILWDPNRE